MEESMYKYKAVLELDDEKIHADGYDVEDAYRKVKEVFADEGVDDISEGKHLAFATKTSKNWSVMTTGFYLLWKSWARPYLKIMKMYNLNNGTVENVITGFECAEKRLGAAEKR